MVTIALGLVNWLVTLLLVESEVTRPIREWVDNRFKAAWYDTSVPKEYASPANPVINVQDAGWRIVFWYKLKYFTCCQLCAGTWVGWVLAAITISWNAPLGTGVLGIVLAGLLYKAIGHLVLVIQKVGECWGSL